MDSMQFLLHFINLFLFLIATGTYISTCFVVRRSHLHSVLRKAFVGACFFGAGLSVLFVFLQLDWIVSEHNVAVGDTVSWAWLVFDYLLAFFMLTVSQAMLVIAKWTDLSTREGGMRWYEVQQQ